MIEIKEHTESGYQPLVAYEGWRVAMANYSERFSKEKLCRMERHLKTDEVFILLHGEATLLIGKERLQIRFLERQHFLAVAGYFNYKENDG